jgi:hypothetical protein
VAQCERCNKQKHRGVCAVPRDPQHPIRSTAAWKREVIFARRELLKAWDNREEIAPWVIKLTDLMTMK